MKRWRYINSVWSSRKNILWNIQYSISAATIWSVCTIKDRYYQLSLLNRCLSDISWRIGLLTRRRDRRTFSKERSVRHREIMEWKKTNTGHIIHPYESVRIREFLSPFTEIIVITHILFARAKACLQLHQSRMRCCKTAKVKIHFRNHLL